MNKKSLSVKCFCNLNSSEFNKFTHKIFDYRKPPKGEINIDFKRRYYRKYLECKICGHFFSQHQLDLTNLYKNDYVNKTYGNYNSLIRKFNKIKNLKKTNSDNYFRVKRIINNLKKKKNPQICDVGSGLGIFPYFFNKNLTSKFSLIETDNKNISFLKKYLKFKNVFKNTEFFKKDNNKFDLITFNKILEHIEKPALLLKKYSKLLKKNGLIYIEVPDVLAAKKSFLREEFFVEHHHIFSLISLIKLVNSSNLQINKIERIIEPSGKFTLYCFCSLNN
jgi:2-polyprenyl-3-methyl-5-hydroxy-6-metoxy-1,4-benzoquinol methylase